jgi:hypothetical protein
MIAFRCSTVGSIAREVALGVAAGLVLDEEVLVVADVLPLLEEVELEEVVVVVLLTVGEATSAAITSASMSSKSSSD